MTIEQAIKKAKKGGWKPTKNQFYDERDNGAPDFGIPMPTYDLPYIYQDPLFWQSLGKAMEWEEWKCTQCNVVLNRCKNPDVHTSDKNDWITHWHRFIDHLAEGKDAESFFANL